MKTMFKDCHIVFLLIVISFDLAVLIDQMDIKTLSLAGQTKEDTLNNEVISGDYQQMLHNEDETKEINMNDQNDYEHASSERITQTEGNANNYEAYTSGSICWYCKNCNECTSYTKTRLKNGDSHPRHNVYNGLQSNSYCSVCYHFCDTICQVGGSLDAITGKMYSMIKAVVGKMMNVGRNKRKTKEFL